MNILIDVGHPAQVHTFRCFAHEMIARGHQVLFTTRDKEFEIALLEAEKLPYVNLGRKQTGKFSRVLFNLRSEWKLLWIARGFHADIFLGAGSINATHIAWLMHKPSILFENTFNMEQIKLYLPFVSNILVSDFEHPLKSDKVLTVPSYRLLFYLHPNRFTPKSRGEVATMLGIKPTERYAILRFVGWHATHDVGHKGFSYENKLKAVKEISKYVKVFISSEDELPRDLQQYKLPTNPEEIFHVMEYASLVLGESSTMVEEAAMLGTMGVLVNVELLLVNDIQRYGLCYSYRDSAEGQIAAINKSVECLAQEPKQFEAEMQLRRQRMLSEKIDVTAWLCWLVENYPQSVAETKNADKDFWQQFK